MITNLKEGERLDDLECNGYRIIQNKNWFCFGTDAVLLSWFAKVRESERVLDMGTGTGVIPILLRAKTSGRQVVGLEIQEEIADMARRSVARSEEHTSELQSRFELVCRLLLEKKKELRTSLRRR